MLFRSLAAGVGLCVLAVLTAAEPEPGLQPSEHPRGYVCYRAAKPIVVDGKPEDTWNDAPWSEQFVDIEGAKKKAPRFKTRVKMLHDESALYIYAELEEPHVWATLKAHDSVIFHDNDFEVFIDPDGDNHAYGELELNALNTTWDLLLTKPYRDQGIAVNGWEIKGLTTAVHVNGTLNNPSDTDRGWSLEIRWPYASLRELARFTIPPADGDQWRINFSRVQWEHAVKDGKYTKASETEDNWVWSPQGAIDMHRPEKWGYLQFSTAKPGRTTFEKDADWPTRDLLHRVYYAQRAFHLEKKSFATEVEKLNLGGAAVPLSGAVQMEATRNMYDASLERPGRPGQKRIRYSISQDGRFKAE